MKISRWFAWLFALAFLAGGGGAALAQNEPTIDQIYQAANGGRLDEARSMIDQVLKNHPKSAKAHYVKAEVAARQREAGVARDELATAERLAPGLPFAKPQSVEALRTQITDLSSAPATQRRSMGAPATAPVPAGGGGLPWGKVIIGLAIALGVIALVRRAMSRSSTAAGPYSGGIPPTNTNYGPGAGPGQGYGPGPGYGPGVPPAGPYPYGAPGAAPSMGSTLGRGLATGLAVGAGAVAAQEIGRRMFDHHGNPVPPDAANANAGNFGLNDPAAMDNVDMGGNDFGINDAGSWDDGGSMDAGDVGGGGDWDNS